MSKQKEITRTDIIKAVEEATIEIAQENKEEILRRARVKLKARFDSEPKFVG